MVSPPAGALTMRPYRLARLAADAEGMRLRSMATRLATRIAFAVIALVFIIGALVFAHLAAWFWLETGFAMSPVGATLILCAVDLVVAIIAGLLASRSTPSRVEREALQVRQQAMTALSGSLNVAQFAYPLLRLAPPLRRSVHK